MVPEESQRRVLLSAASGTQLGFEADKWVIFIRPGQGRPVAGNWMVSEVLNRPEVQQSQRQLAWRWLREDRTPQSAA